MKTQIKTSKGRTPKFAAGLVALSMAVTAAYATPARADDADVARVIGGLVTLFVIGKAIENSGSKSKASTAASHQVTLNDHGKRHDRRTARKDTFEIPNSCVVSVRDKRKRVQSVALENCVMRERRSAVALPRACETKVNTKRGRTDAYDVGCLNNFGYRITHSNGGKSGRALR